MSLPGSTEVKCAKGVFPYSFCDSLAKLHAKEFPPIEAFFNDLTQAPLSAEDYLLAQRAWKEFGCSTMGEYMKGELKEVFPSLSLKLNFNFLAYLRLDVYLLADVFEAFRKMALQQDGLDPVNYVGLPGFTWDSAFKMTGTELHLLQEPEMYRFFEAGTKGGKLLFLLLSFFDSKNLLFIGMTFVNKHRVKAEPGVELLYIDANNLYGQALSMKLPQKDFLWVEDPNEQKDILASLADLDVLGGNVGYTFEVDLIIPPHIHDLLDDLPLAPENRIVENPTAYMRELWARVEGEKKYRAGKKLILSHLDKNHYVVHFALLQYYMKMGCEVTKIHRLVRYCQTNFFEQYISFNSKKRQEATTEFEKDFYKLKNNGESLIFDTYVSINFTIYLQPSM